MIIENATLFELCTRLNEINKEMDNLEMEQNKIIKELWDRIPSLKDDVNIQPKKRERKYESNRTIK